jgi:hypothetical protein
MPLRFHIQDMRIIAQQLGGKCLSKEYIDSYTPLKWMCENGHTWDLPYSKISQGAWCSQCAHDEYKLERYAELKQIAQQKQGRLLSPKYIKALTKLKWQCRRGHTWWAVPASIKNIGTWCFKCSVIDNAEKAKDSIDKYKKIAQKHSGKLLSAVYINSQTKLKWQCANKHEWWAKPNNVSVSKSWCPYCAGTAKHTIADMRTLAAKRGGKCLSSTYRSVKHKLTWQCSEQHIWKAIPGGIIKGQWCPQCKAIRAGNRYRADIKDIQALARSRGGKLLSATYINANTPVKWQCSKGHQWMTRAAQVKWGTWCPVCAGTAKHSIEDMQTLAKARQGKCLSQHYINTKTKLQWQCHKKHIWKTAPGNIVSGRWCPQCALERRKLPRPKRKSD